MKVSKYFSDGMVIQSEKPFKVWGKAACGIVNVSVIGEKLSVEKAVQSFQGEFCVEFEGIDASFDTYVIKIADEEHEAEFKNIKFGEVFLFAGQSNMSYPVTAMDNYHDIIKDLSLIKEDIAALSIGESFIQKNGEVFRPDCPQDDLCGDYKWQNIDNSNANTTSALAVMVALRLRKKLDKPIGIVVTSLGGLSIDSYLKREIVEKNKKVKDFLVKTGKYIDASMKYNVYPISNYTQMSGIYNEKIHPILNANYNAIIWYQGENSAATYKHSSYYLNALKALVNAFRQYFNEKKLPFIAINIANCYYPNGEFGYNYINEAINIACNQMSNCYAIAGHDIIPNWLPNDEDRYFHLIHPTNKQIISKRTADVILNNIYFKKTYKFPMIDNVEFFEDYALATVKDLVQPLKKQDVIYGFTIANSGKKYYKAYAEIVGCNQVKIYNKNVKKPKYITYAFFQNNYICNLVTENMMPVLQYRTAAEECLNKSYYITSLAESCDFEKIFENNFGYEVGGGYMVDCWKAGQITDRKNTSFSFNEKQKYQGKTCIKIDYNKKSKDYGYFGISPNINVCGQQNNFHNYESLTCLVKSAEKVEFHGLLAKINNGKIIKFRVDNGGCLTQFVELTDGYTLYKINLTNAQYGDESAHKTDKELLKSINTLEFYFRAKESCTVYFDSFELI